MLIYLDTSVVIAWMKKENDNADLYSGIADIMRNLSSPITTKKHAINNTGIYVITSVILIVEVLPSSEYVQKYNELEVDIKPVDKRISEKAQELRAKFGFKTPDAIHIATAICWQSDYLLTADKGMLKHAEAISNMTKGKTKITKPPVPGIQLSLPDSQ